MSKTDTIKLLRYILLAFFIAGCAQNPKDKVAVETSGPTYTTLYDVFSRYDTNSDNLLDSHEFHQFQLDPEIIALRERIPEAARTRPILFDEIDENADKRISLEEITVIAEGYIPKIE